MLNIEQSERRKKRLYLAEAVDTKIDYSVISHKDPNPATATPSIETTHIHTHISQPQTDAVEAEEDAEDPVSDTETNYQNDDDERTPLLKQCAGLLLFFAVKSLLKLDLM